MVHLFLEDWHQLMTFNYSFSSSFLNEFINELMNFDISCKTVTNSLL